MRARDRYEEAKKRGQGDLFAGMPATQPEQPKRRQRDTSAGRAARDENLDRLKGKHAPWIRICVAWIRANLPLDWGPALFEDIKHRMHAGGVPLPEGKNGHKAYGALARHIAGLKIIIPAFGMGVPKDEKSHASAKGLWQRRRL